MGHLNLGPGPVSAYGRERPARVRPAFLTSVSDLERRDGEHQSLAGWLHELSQGEEAKGRLVWSLWWNGGMEKCDELDTERFNPWRHVKSAQRTM